ncbi:MAG: zinc transporter ZntB [Myxococcota bacterium]
MSEREGLIWAYDVDAGGRGREIGWDELDGTPQAGFRWIHLERGGEDVRRWVTERSGLSELEAEALLAEETRPRANAVGEGLLLILRGVNLNPGADPEDMVAVRLWVDARRVVTVRRRRLLALQDLRDRVAAGRGPRNVGEFVADLGDHLVERMAGILGDLDERLDQIEERDTSDVTPELRGDLVDLRRQAIVLRRYLSPQRDALARLTTERLAWLGDAERQKLREVHDRTTRYVEDLEAARERAAVTQEAIASRLAEQLNQRMYALSIVAGIFLPLSFLTGLLGINVGGMPGVDSGGAFVAVCGALALLTVGEVLLFRRLGWL